MKKAKILDENPIETYLNYVKKFRAQVDSLGYVLDKWWYIRDKPTKSFLRKKEGKKHGCLYSPETHWLEWYSFQTYDSDGVRIVNELARLNPEIDFYIIGIVEDDLS